MKKLLEENDTCNANC